MLVGDLARCQAKTLIGGSLSDFYFQRLKFSIHVRAASFSFPLPLLLLLYLFVCLLELHQIKSKQRFWVSVVCFLWVWFFGLVWVGFFVPDFVFLLNVSSSGNTRSFGSTPEV